MAGESTAMQVLVVEDDTPMCEAIERGLGLHGMTVRAAASAEDALAMISRRRPDLLVVDVGLPGMSGIELCREMRARHVDQPVLILSARDAVGDRVAGLEAGADDYLVKPFDLDELVARLKALQRRASQPVSAGRANVATSGSIWMDLDRRSVRCGATSLDLTRREFDLLEAFVSNAGIVMARPRLLELVWGYDFEVEGNVVDVFVGYLRRKLDAAGLCGAIVTVRGVGFVLRPTGA